MRSPPEPCFDPDNPQQVPLIPYPPVLNNSFSFPTPPLSSVIFLYILPTSLLILLVLLLLAIVLYSIHLLGIVNFSHFLNELVIHHFGQPNFVFQNISCDESFYFDFCGFLDV